METRSPSNYSYYEAVLCTVVWDSYGWDERKLVWQALQSLLLGEESDWSRKGLYVYWDPQTREMLYTGLARDLAERFAQHNGLVRHSGGNKLPSITEWFSQHPRIGFSVLLQAAGVQVLDTISEMSLTLGARSDDIIRAAEGQVIELHRLERGSRPRWNDVGGAIRGREWAVDSGRSLIRVLTSETDSLFVARATVRDLADDDVARGHEVTIHGGRIHALMASHELGNLPENPRDASHFILKSFMLRNGHLIDDLSVSDSQIIDRLRQIEDGRVLAEYRLMRERLEQMAPEVGPDSDRDVALMLYMTAIRAELDHPTQAASVTDLFRSGYLSRAPSLVLNG